MSPTSAGSTIGLEAQGAVERQADAHERDEHSELGEVLDDRVVLQGVGGHTSGQGEEADRVAEHEQHDGRRDRGPREDLGQHDRQQERQAEDEVQRGAPMRSLRTP